MALPFATKLRLALLWPALAAVLLAGLLLAWLLPQRFEQTAASELVETADLLAPLVAEHIERDARPLQSWVHQLAGEQLRVTIIRADGLVLADSARTDAELAHMENHAGRPEVHAALTVGAGSAIRHSATTGITYAYAARAIQPSHGPLLVVRVAQPVRALSVLEEQLARAALLAGLAALLATGVISWWMSRRLFRPLAEMIRGADRLGAGAPGARLAAPVEPELATLAATINRLAARAEEQLAAAERERDHLRSILASMAEGVLVTDAAGRALLANPAFLRLFGIAPAVEGRLPIELARVPALQEVVREAIAGRAPATQEVVLERPLRRHAALTAAPLGAAGVVGGGGAVVVARDITPFVRLEEVRRDFVANVSHELKTPLAAIRGLAETLQDGALTDGEAGPRFLGRILEQCGRLEALLADLLTLARLESPAGRQEPEEVELGELARAAAETVAPAAVERDVAIDLDVHEARLRGDADALERLLLNLLDNAVKYNRPGGRVRLRVVGDGASALVEVKDSGIGISPDHLPRIFERFYRVDRGRSRAEGGTGLGLAIVKHVAQLHGGSVEVESTPGEGSTFRVRLPLRR